ncbi:reverse transcriptase domain-containing protein [Chitinophaga sp. CF418]|uniref:reverse transcriptase domain-containing protein n=1 Tax=Chitinophaga sp. CF418 TaxID=1855287 RepID=UPI00091B56E9|nr:reverse transcriptase domain-containing protein [Chitinophaga sp. CF418]SHN45656.1 group II intron reverse transcriptase/maturase [Chitinophaga sp. CF418]
MIDYYETKAHPITKRMVLDAYKKVKSNKGSAGVDEQSLEDYGKNLPQNLYKLWNRMTSGSYQPSLVKRVAIPKSSGGKRILGIPTVEDRIAQQVVKAYLEPKVDGTFHDDSYGYRPAKNAQQALNMVEKRCSNAYPWVLDLDIKSFFDTIDHNLMMKAVEHYTREKWILLYIRRWLEIGTMDGNEVVGKRLNGTPQGGVLAPRTHPQTLSF